MTVGAKSAEIAGGGLASGWWKPLEPRTEEERGALSL